MNRRLFLNVTATISALSMAVASGKAAEWSGRTQIAGIPCSGVSMVRLFSNNKHEITRGFDFSSHRSCCNCPRDALKSPSKPYGGLARLVN